MLQLEDVNAYYGTSHALHDVALEIEEGQTVGLIGRNGAGKTTTLRSIMGLVNRTGDIRFKDDDISELQPNQVSNRGIGFIPEERRIFTSLSVHENLLTGVVDDDDVDRIDDIYEIFPRLNERRTQDGSTLSGGEQQMLAIGRTLVSNPDLILVDEPSEGLMPSLVEQIKQTIIDLNESGHTILLIEQNASMVFGISDYVYVIDKGQIRVDDTPETLRDDEEIRRKYLSV